MTSVGNYFYTSPSTSSNVPFTGNVTLVTANLTSIDAANITGTIDNTSLPQTIDIDGGLSSNTVTTNVLTTDQIVSLSGNGIMDANLLTGQLDGDIVFLDGHLEMTTLSADDITLAGNSLLAEISNIKNTDLSTFTVQDGSAAAPSVAFQSDSDTGVFRSGTNTVALAAGGATALTANATHVTANNVVATTVSATDILINGNSATTLRTDTWLQSTDGQDRVYYDTNGNTQFAGNVEANAFVGDGQFLSNVATTDASTLISGTLDNARLPQTITISGDLTANAVYGNLDLTNQTVDGELTVLDTLVVDTDVVINGNSVETRLADLESRLAALEA
jgi:hypothetical protein